MSGGVQGNAEINWDQFTRIRHTVQVLLGALD